MKNNQPVFSIIIPVYNAEKYLRPALDSVLAQTYTNWECVCVDDGSTDASASILDEYAARDKRFRVVHQKNSGVSVARNVGLEAAVGEWITWLDADDIYASWRLEDAFSIIEQEAPDIIRFRTYFFSGTDGCSFQRKGYSVYVGENAVSWCWNQMFPAGMMWTTVIRRSLFEDVRFVPNVRVKEEATVCAELSLRAGKTVQSESIAYAYRQLPDSAMHQVRKADDCIKFLGVMRDFLIRHPDLVSVARKRLRMHCECDVIDWILRQQGERHRACDIFTRYNEVKAVGDFACGSIQQMRYRLPMWWWDKTGQIWPIEIVGRLVRFYGLLRRSL